MTLGICADERLNDIVGTACYVDPEVLLRSYGTKMCGASVSLYTSLFVVANLSGLEKSLVFFKLFLRLIQVLRKLLGLLCLLKQRTLSNVCLTRTLSLYYIILYHSLKNWNWNWLRVSLYLESKSFFCQKVQKVFVSADSIQKVQNDQLGTFKQSFFKL